MAQPYPYLDDSVRLVRTPISRSIQNYDSISNASPIMSNYSNAGSPTSSFTSTLFRMSSRYDLGHQPRQYFFYISVICMLYCVIYRLFFYYTLYETHKYNEIDGNGQENSLEISIYFPWILSLNGYISLICLSILSFITILITLIRIHNQCNPENVQILLFSLLRLCVMYILNIIIVYIADSFILFTFISYVFSPSSSSNSNHVDIFWQSIRKYLQETDKISLNEANINAMNIYDDIDENKKIEKMKRLITIHYYCMTLYIKQTTKFSNKHYSAGIFGRKQQQKAIQRLRPIIFNEYNQKGINYSDNIFKFGISTPQSISSYQRRNFMKMGIGIDNNNTINPMINKRNNLKNDDLHIWFSVILWMPVFLNDNRYQWYWIIEKILLRISLIIILIFIIYTETKSAIIIHIIPIPTIIRCILEIINLLNLIPFVIYDDPDFDNVAELYSSRELSTSITKKKRNDIIKEINKTYTNYCKIISIKQQQNNRNININNNNNNPNTNIMVLPTHSFELQQTQLQINPNQNQIQQILDITPAQTPRINATVNNIKNYNMDDDSTDYEEEEEDND